MKAVSLQKAYAFAPAIPAEDSRRANSAWPAGPHRQSYPKAARQGRIFTTGLPIDSVTIRNTPRRFGNKP
jgi:hypothetical protein